MLRLFTSGLIGFPAASIPCDRAVHCGPAASNTSVCRCGGGPGLNVDFARLRSHVPTRDSICADAGDAMTATRHNDSTTRIPDLGAWLDAVSPRALRIAKTCIIDALLFCPETYRARRQRPIRSVVYFLSKDMGVRETSPSRALRG